MRSAAACCVRQALHSALCLSSPPPPQPTLCLLALPPPTALHKRAPILRGPDHPSHSQGGFCQALPAGAAAWCANRFSGLRWTGVLVGGGCQQRGAGGRVRGGTWQRACVLPTTSSSVPLPCCMACSRPTNPALSHSGFPCANGHPPLLPCISGDQHPPTRPPTHPPMPPGALRAVCELRPRRSPHFPSSAGGAGTHGGTCSGRRAAAVAARGLARAAHQVRCTSQHVLQDLR